MHKLLSCLSLVAALAAPGALHASMMSGQFSIQGTVSNDPTTHVLSFIPETIATGVGTQTGTFATLLTDNEHATAGTPTIAYDPYVAGSSFFDEPASSCALDFVSILSSSSTVEAFLKFLILRPRASPIPGSLLAPNTTRTMRRITISSPIPGMAVSFGWCRL